MTKKTAIKQLKMLKEHLKNDMYADDVHALNTAIQALESLDKIKAEISKQEIEYRKQNDRCGVGLDMALRIIDKYIGDTE